MASGIAVVVVGAMIVVRLRDVLLLVLTSFVIALGVQPGVTWCERHGIRRGWAVAGMMAASLLIVVGFMALIVPIVLRQLGELIQAGPGLLARAQRGNGLVSQLDQQFHLVDTLKRAGGQLPATAFAVAKSLTALLFVVITVAILTAYIATSLPALRRSVAKVLVRKHRRDLTNILEQATTRIGGYLMGNVVVSMIAGIVTFATLSALRIPYALALALWVALTDLIPTIGAYLGAIPAIIIASFVGPVQALATFALFLVYQLIENAFIAPHVMKEAIRLNPALVLIAVLVGGALFGIIGCILALPVAAVIKILLEEFYVDDRIEEVRDLDRQAGDS